MSLSHALLAALSQQCATGYELAQHFDGCLGHFWKASHQQIYRDLAKLEAQGQVQHEVMPQVGKPERKLYQITPLGLGELQRWIASPADPSPIRDALLVKLYAGNCVEPAVLLAELAQQRAQHANRLEMYQAIESQYFADPASLAYAQRLIWLTLQAGLMYEQQRLAWCDLALKEINRC
ncbi:MAG: PadR family transcriptional regulator [Candidatus Sericytochromatia bacterium]|nr:PadR family transcriptional regulator [Candidatus Sericytochromatia bacterium]